MLSFSVSNYFNLDPSNLRIPYCIFSLQSKAYCTTMQERAPLPFWLKAFRILGSNLLYTGTSLHFHYTLQHCIEYHFTLDYRSATLQKWNLSVLQKKNLESNMWFMQPSRDFNFVIIYAIVPSNRNSKIFRIDLKMLLIETVQ